MTLAWQAAPARLDDRVRLYAIGDVHGMAGRLAALHGQVAEDLAARPVARAVVVHLGDYVDKAGDPAAVLELVAGFRLPGAVVVNLLGNHEAMMRDALAGDRAAVDDWLWCGGRVTLASYGLAPEAGPEAWAVAIPEGHQALLRDGLALSHREGPYFLAHAGIRPGVALEAQSAEDLLTIRGPFLHHEGPHPAVIVHGHTARLAPEIRANRINLDTAAHAGGLLTCGVLEQDRIAFLTA
ncbi:metallophosphoesterase [Falsiroseomonas ponticola]|uniref:metallophosphoesterase n=1 Tax=Falsiroseomonas ponticola TaxID=2786951 RepID=UPI00299F4C04|nr:metallophosphoesterase [Roseomonas ponticola]